MVASVLENRAMAALEVNEPTAGNLSANLSMPSLNAGDRVFNCLKPKMLATMMAINGQMLAIKPSDRPTTNWVKAGSSAPKPSNISAKIGMTNINKMADTTTANISTVMG